MNVRCLCLASLLLSLAPASAGAAGRLLARGSAGVQLREARVALSRGPARATAWHQLLVDGAAEELLWLLPVPAGVGVDVAATSFFDALEESTAPRVLAPSGAPPGGQLCPKPSPEVISSGEGGAALALLGQEVFSEPAAVVPGIEKLGYAISAAEAPALEAAASAGGRLLALRLAAPQGVGATITVRLHGSGVELGALPLLRASTEAVPFVLWMVGTSRGKAAGLDEVEMEPSALRWLGASQTNYTSLRRAILEKAKGTSAILEVAGPGPLRDLTALPGGNDVPAFLDAYLRRAFERGEATGDLGAFSDEARAALDGSYPDGCPRGDLLPPEGFTCTLPGAQDPLVPSPGADDLAFTFPGNASLRWVSRFAGLIPGASAGPPVVAGFPGGEPVSILLTPASVWDGLCSASGVGGSSGGGLGGKNGGGGFGAGGPGPSGVGGSGGSDGSIDLDETASAVDAGCSCANIFVNESCNGNSEGTEGDSEGCNCSDTSTTGEEDGGSSEGCSCDDSSSGEGDSCSGSDSGSDGGDSCSGSEGSGGGDACGSGTSGGGDSCGKDCSVSRRGRRSPRLSKWLLVVAAAALPLRRWRRPRDRKRRKELVAG